MNLLIVLLEQYCVCKHFVCKCQPEFRFSVLNLIFFCYTRLRWKYFILCVLYTYTSLYCYTVKNIALHITVLRGRETVYTYIIWQIYINFFSILNQKITSVWLPSTYNTPVSYTHLDVYKRQPFLSHSRAIFVFHSPLSF